MNIIERWLLVIADIRVQMGRAASRGEERITPEVVNVVIGQHTTGKCDICTSHLCCDFMRLTALTYGVLNAAAAQRR